MDEQFTLIAPKRATKQKRSPWIPLILGIVLVSAIGFWIYSVFLTGNGADQGKNVIELPWEETEKVPLTEDPEAFPRKEPLTKKPTLEPFSDRREADASLPALDDSDDLTRRVTVDVSSHASWPIWLIPNQLVRKFTMLVDNVSRGSVPRKQFLHLAPKGRFKPQGQKGSYTINPESYRRYDTFADVVGSMNTEKLLAAYQKLSPLFQKAYAELGHPNKKFADLLNAAIKKILETPNPEGEIKLVRPSVVYKFADPQLESLSPAQKQLLRMGPRNIQIIRTKLEEISTFLNKTGGNQIR